MSLWPSMSFWLRLITPMYPVTTRRAFVCTSDSVCWQRFPAVIKLLLTWLSTQLKFIVCIYSMLLPSSLINHETSSPAPIGVHCFSRNDLELDCSDLVVQSYTSWQCHPSTLYSLHGLPLLFIPSTIPNITVFNFPLSSILQMWPNSQSFLCMALCSSFPIPSFSQISQFIFRSVQQKLHRQSSFSDLYK